MIFFSEFTCSTNLSNSCHVLVKLSNKSSKIGVLTCEFDNNGPIFFFDKINGPI